MASGSGAVGEDPVSRIGRFDYDGRAEYVERNAQEQAGEVGTAGLVEDKVLLSR